MLNPSVDGFFIAWAGASILSFYLVPFLRDFVVEKGINQPFCALFCPFLKKKGTADARPGNRKNTKRAAPISAARR